jgi:ABC-type antimicrobial peptide transport system permease subunit
MRRLGQGVFAMLFSFFALVALVLGSVGLYAVMAHSVSRRTREIGVRLALGGSSRKIFTMVLAQGLRQVALGLAIGMPLAYAVTRVLRARLVGVGPGDPLTFASVILVLAAAGLFGSAIPARRAIRVDPIEALRHE